MSLVGGLSAQTPDTTAVITIAAEPDYPPYSFVDESGRAAGFSVELFQAVAETMDLELEIKTGLWATIREELAEGQIDALPLVGRTPERETVFDFTVPYLSLYGGIVVRTDNNEINNLEDLRGGRIAVMKGDNAEEFLRRNGFEQELTTVPTFVDAMALVQEGESDAVVMQRIVALRILEGGGFAGLRVLNDRVRGFRQDFCFAVTEGDKELLAILNEGLSIVAANGTLRRLLTRWFAAPELPARRIIVGGDDNFPPFEYLDEHGHPAGYNVDLTREIARELGLDIEIRLGPWTDIVAMLRRGEIDVIQGMMYSAVWDESFDFSPARTIQHQVAIGRDRPVQEVPSSAEGLRGSSIVVQAGDIMHEYAIENGLTQDLTVVRNQEEALRLVHLGEIDYALGSRLTAVYLIGEHGWDDLVVGRRELVSHGYGYAVLEGNARLLSFFSDGLAILEETGEYHRIYEKWLGVYETPSLTPWVIVRSTLFIVVPLLLLLLTVMLWNRTLRKQVALRTAELRESERLYRLLSENTADVIWLLSPDLRFRYVNAAIRFLTGYTQEEWIGTRLRDHFGSDVFRTLVGVVDTTVITRSGERGFGVETDLRKKDGSTVHVEIAGTFLRNGAGEVEGLQGVARDISDRRRYQKTLEETNRSLALSLEEKKTLLKEVHHRVKNNLSVIVSLLRLQEDRIENVASARSAFEQSRNRIHSMALIHESLYRSENFAEVELDRYIRELMGQLAEGMSGDRSIRYRDDLEPVLMSIEYAVPCGIIVNELVTNAYKYASRDGEPVEITVTLRNTGLAVLLSVGDNGAGLPAGFSIEESSTLGLTLVRLLADQIDGTLEISGDAGTVVTLRIPVHAGDPQPTIR